MGASGAAAEVVAGGVLQQWLFVYCLFDFRLKTCKNGTLKLLL